MPKVVAKKTVAKKVVKNAPPSDPPAPKAGGLAKWQSHLKAYRTAHPDQSLKQCMQESKKTYHK